VKKSPRTGTGKYERLLASCPLRAAQRALG
jgi:hypothetical protein